MLRASASEARRRGTCPAAIEPRCQPPPRESKERCYVGNLLLFFIMLRQGVSGFKGSATWVLARTPGWLESRDSLANGASHQQSRSGPCLVWRKNIFMKIF